MDDENKYAEITLNERLYVSGNLLKFENAAKERDVEKVIEILKQVEIKTASIDPILEQLGLK